jgi:serine/threonine protein kinase
MGQAQSCNVPARSGRGEDGAGGSGSGVSNSTASAGGGDEFAAATTPLASLSSDACENEMQFSEAIETSKAQGWSELRDGGQEGASASGHADDARAWEELKKSYPCTFRDFPELELKFGRKIAEGGQAQIFEASFRGAKSPYVAKVFKREGFSLADLQRQWPLTTKLPDFRKPGDSGFSRKQSKSELFVLGGIVFCDVFGFCTSIDMATLLEDGRFVIIMDRYWGDLRTLINLKMKENNFQGPPFSSKTVKKIMLQIALGMYKLHERGVLHRDLKAANILVKSYPCESCGCYECDVADYESGMLVEGTGFWRAPEVLQDLLKNRSERDVGIWTEKVDVYSYGMTCYEVLTGQIPFPLYFKSDWKKVINGERPPFPDYVDSRLRKLVKSCWHKEPSCRPTFVDIIKRDLGNPQF